MPEDYDEIFQYVIKLNAQIRDWPYGEAYGKVYSGMGVYPLTNQPEDFFTAQYNADICRVESPEGVETRGYVEYLKSLGCDYGRAMCFTGQCLWRSLRNAF